MIVQKIEEATRYLIGNKIAGKITSVAKSQKKEKEDETGIIIPPEKIQQITDYLSCFKHSIKMEYQKIANLVDTTSNNILDLLLKNRMKFIIPLVMQKTDTNQVNK